MTAPVAPAPAKVAGSSQIRDDINDYNSEYCLQKQKRRSRGMSFLSFGSTASKRMSFGTTASSNYQVIPTEVYLRGLSGYQCWYIFCKERLQPVIYIVMGAGSSLSAFYLLSNGLDSPKLIPTIWSVLSQVLLLTCLRIMDDHKDWETDVTSHPDRPIPRGLLMPIEVCRAIYLLLILLILDVMCTYFYSSHAAAVMLLACVVYQYLMWREFFIPQAMHASPLLAAITHQPLSMVYFAFFVASQWGTFDFVRDPRTWWWGLAMMSAGFSYEVTRKLDPLAHPDLGTYLVTYGRVTTIALVAVACGTSAYLSTATGPAKAGVAYLLWPFDGLVLLSTIYLLYSSSWALPPVTRNGITYGSDGDSRDDRILAIQKGDRVKPHGHRVVELFSSISVLIHIYAISVRSWTHLQSP